MTALTRLTKESVALKNKIRQLNDDLEVLRRRIATLSHPKFNYRQARLELNNLKDLERKLEEERVKTQFKLRTIDRFLEIYDRYLKGLVPKEIVEKELELLKFYLPDIEIEFKEKTEPPNTEIDIESVL